MTLNLNLFKRRVLEQIGGLDENYHSAFAEPILLIKIRSRGFRVLMVGEAKAFHFDELTKKLGETSIMDQYGAMVQRVPRLCVAIRNRQFATVEDAVFHNAECPVSFLAG